MSTGLREITTDDIQVALVQVIAPRALQPARQAPAWPLRARGRRGCAARGPALRASPRHR